MFLNQRNLRFLALWLGAAPTLSGQGLPCFGDPENLLFGEPRQLGAAVNRDPVAAEGGLGILRGTATADGRTLYFDVVGTRDFVSFWGSIYPPLHLDPSGKLESCREPLGGGGRVPD